jgi:hypothetical protein
MDQVREEGLGVAAGDLGGGFGEGGVDGHRVSYPPPPQVSLSGSNWLLLLGLEAMPSFNRMITNGLRVINRKTKELAGLCRGQVGGIERVQFL